MALFVLTEENHTHLKHLLRSAYPNVKASHRAEALAAACGFRTNISLLSNLRDGHPNWPELVDVRSDLFVARLTEIGYLGISGSPIAGLVRSPEMPERIWISCKAEDIHERAVWFSECQRRDIPYMYVTTRRKYADIDWDCISTDTRHDDVTTGKNSEELMRHMFKTFQSIAFGPSKKAFFDASSFVGGIKDVPIEIASEMTDAMFSILYEAIKKNELGRTRRAIA